jgi:uncharacterized protein YdcH (DUF465 family)
MENHDALHAELLNTDDQYRRLFEQHQACERRLEELQNQTLPSQEDELEEKQLKRQKLTFKDQMAAYERNYHEAAVPA